jgi:hypothetical protein
MERIRLRARATLLVTALTLAVSGAGASGAGASGPVTPINGSVGACNMTNANASFGMFVISQSVANPRGWDVGMGIAIAKSNPTDQGFCG